MKIFGAQQTVVASRDVYSKTQGNGSCVPQDEKYWRHGGKDSRLKTVKENAACRDIHDTEDSKRAAFWILIVPCPAYALQTLLGEKQTSLKLIGMQLECITANGDSASHWVQWLRSGYQNNTYKSWKWSWDSMCLPVGLTSLSTFVISGFCKGACEYPYPPAFILPADTLLPMAQRIWRVNWQIENITPNARCLSTLTHFALGF